MRSAAKNKQIYSIFFNHLRRNREFWYAQAALLIIKESKTENLATQMSKSPLKKHKSQKKRANEAKKRENSNRGWKFLKRIAVFLLYFCDFAAYFSHFSKYFPPYSPILRVFRISSPHFHLFSVVCIDTHLRHPQSGATFQHLRKFHPCFVHGKALLRSFSPHLQRNRKKNCAFSHLFS